MENCTLNWFSLSDAFDAHKYSLTRLYTSSTETCFSNMAYPKTTRSWRRTASPYPLSIVLSKETLPGKLGPQDVVIRIHAVSLNYRDVAMLREGGYPVLVETGGICASDCAAEVVAVGAKASKFKIGDRVAPTVDLENLTGEERDTDPVALGGNGPGVLREYAVFEEKFLVKLPNHLSWEEVSGGKITCSPRCH
jgi:D-arabinose 1-dehydrogenase-like Zn-dependent alcohol dehydrogenase